MNRNKQLTIP